MLNVDITFSYDYVIMVIVVYNGTMILKCCNIICTSNAELMGWRGKGGYYPRRKAKKYEKK